MACRAGDSVAAALTLDATVVYVLAVIFVATLIRSTIGFGEALVAVPLLALRIPIAVAAPLAVSVSLLIAGVIVVQDWRHIEVRSASGLILSSLAGIPFGLLLLAFASDHVVRLILGLAIVSFAIYSITAAAKWRLDADHPFWLAGAGFCSGVLGGAYGMNGPPLAIYGGLRRWSPQRFRATLQAYFLIASAAGLAGYVAIGLWRPDVTRYVVLSLPVVGLGIVAGRWLNHRLRGDRFFQVIYAALILLGAVLVAQAVRAWPV
jgi:uncharacterized membrane protein YfcA